MFKNKAEREKFLREYVKWHKAGFGKYDFGSAGFHEAEIDFYRFKFRNGAAVIVTKVEGDARYNLIIPEGDDYNPYDRSSGWTPAEFRRYGLTGTSVSVIADYMTKRKDEI